MNALSALPDAIYLRDVISTDEERLLMEALDRGQWSAELKRRVQHFGYRYDYRARTVAQDAYIDELPEWLRSIGERLTRERLFPETPDQVIANEYQPGQGISAHVDCVPCFNAEIASLSLLSPCEMIFRRQGGDGSVLLDLEPRLLLFMTGQARYGWTHEIPARKSDMIYGQRRPRSRRVSLTFRRVMRAD